MYKYLGFLFGITSFVCLVLLSFAYRELSIPLVLMFLLALVGPPLSTYFLIRRKDQFMVSNQEDDKALDVEGKFCI